MRICAQGLGHSSLEPSALGIGVVVYCLTVRKNTTANELAVTAFFEHLLGLVFHTLDYALNLVADVMRMNLAKTGIAIPIVGNAVLGSNLLLVVVNVDAPVIGIEIKEDVEVESTSLIVTRDSLRLDGDLELALMERDGYRFLGKIMTAIIAATVLFIGAFPSLFS